MNPAIDIVLPWVDGGDKNWLAERSKYIPDENTDDNACRYRDWNNLQYLFRGIEKFMPWVRTVHLVTWGHLPKWLNTSAEGLNIVNHTDYIPAKYLPTFNSHTIELNFHRIKGLSENFVYFNDDVFPIKPIPLEVFFVDGLPCEEARLDYITSTDSDIFPHILLNNIDVINRHFNKKSAMKSNFGKWFSLKYGGETVIKNLLLFPFNNFPGIKWFHLAAPMKKSTLETLWELEPDLLDATCSCRRRSISNINFYTARNWNIASGRFHPYPVHKSGLLCLLPSQTDELIDILKNQSYYMVCANDTENITDFDTVRDRVNTAFSKLLPDKSRFEL